MKAAFASLLKLTAGAAIVACIASCRTMKGAGQDIQHLGNKIESEASQHSHY